jgi:hypothetical protein
MWLRSQHHFILAFGKQENLINFYYKSNRKALLYEDADLPINQQRTKNLIHSHNPKSTTITMDFIDVSGFDNQSQQVKGWSKIHENFNLKQKSNKILKKFTKIISREYMKPKNHSEFPLRDRNHCTAIIGGQKKI